MPDFSTWPRRPRRRLEDPWGRAVQAGREHLPGPTGCVHRRPCHLRFQRSRQTPLRPASRSAQLWAERGPS